MHSRLTTWMARPRFTGRSKRSSQACGVLFALVLLTSVFGAGNAEAQFRNNGVMIPKISYHSMAVQDIGYYLLAQNVEPLNWISAWAWNSTGHVTVSSGYFRALGYNLWLVVEGGFGIGVSTFPPPGPLPTLPVFSLQASTGLRYNIFDEEYRPFIAGHIQYIQLFSAPGTKLPSNQIQGLTDYDDNAAMGQALGNALSHNFVGAKLGGGFEWFFLTSLRRWGYEIPIFYDEMSVQAEAYAAGYVNFQGPLHSVVVSGSYNVYF